MADKQRNLTEQEQVAADEAEFDKYSETKAAAELTRSLEDQVEFPLFEDQTQSLVLTMEEVRSVISNKTKSGKEPTDADIRLFLKLCKARQLNPYAKDAYLIGYEVNGVAEFHSVVAHSALLKRAVANKAYRGKKSGVIVHKDGTGMEGLVYCKGAIYPRKGYTLMGAWCEVMIEGRENEFKEAQLEAFDKKRARWNTDKPGMIIKCAEGLGLRAAFPLDLADMYLVEELDHLDAKTEPSETKVQKERTRLPEQEVVEAL